MTEPLTKPKRVIIVGGSVGGLFSGVVLTRLGYDVTILERAPGTALVDQGAGQSVTPSLVPALVQASKDLGTSGSPLVDFTEQYDRTKTSWYTLADGFKYLKRDGSTKTYLRFPHMLGVTSWGLQYNALRANFDGGYKEGYVAAAGKENGDGGAEYLSGITVTDLKDAGSTVIVEYRDSNSSGRSLEADFVIGADGPSSFVRRLFLPETERTYAGYVCWRGTVKETLLSEATETTLADNVVAFHGRGSHTISYTIPSLEGVITPGQRVANLVWYYNQDRDELKDILTESSGISHSYSLGIGKIRPELKSKQAEIAAKTLPPHIVEIFQKIEQPFIQAVTDSLTFKSVFMNGKVLLVGDAVAGLRPHVASGTSQAAIHALLLRKVFEDRLSLDEWEKRVLEWSGIAYKAGVSMGELSQFSSINRLMRRSL